MDKECKAISGKIDPLLSPFRAGTCRIYPPKTIAENKKMFRYFKPPTLHIYNDSFPDSGYTIKYSVNERGAMEFMETLEDTT